MDRILGDRRSLPDIIVGYLTFIVNLQTCLLYWLDIFFWCYDHLFVVMWIYKSNNIDEFYFAVGIE